MNDVYRIRYPGVIDADGHILEPPDLWERYLEPRYRERALRIRTDDEGLEYLEIGGKPSLLSRKGFPGTLGAMGKTHVEDVRPNPERTYLRGAPHGSMDMKERLERLDAENLEAAVLYPTIGILWEAELEEPELTDAYCRAYNRWIAEFCFDSGGRLVPIAHVSLSDPAAAAKELERAVRDGCRGAFVMPYTWSRLPHGHPDHDPLFAAAQDLGVPLAIHPGFEPPAIASVRFTLQRKLRLLASATAGDGVRHAFTTFFDFGVFDRFPGLRVVVLESGAGWIGYWLDRMDAVYESPQGMLVRELLPEPPSAYFRRQCWISGDPDETSLAAVMSVVGADRFFWASDFPHPDHAPEYVPEVERIAAQLPESARAGFLGRNVLRAYGIEG